MVKTFLFFKIESWIFQHLFEIEFRETSQTFNSFRSFSSFRQSLFLFCLAVVWLSWTFVMKFFFKQMLKVSVFYLEKQKSFIPKQNIFSEGFGSTTKSILDCVKVTCNVPCTYQVLMSVASCTVLALLVAQTQWTSCLNHWQ